MLQDWFSKAISSHFPNRDELLLRTVIALPKVSRTTFVSSTLSSMPPCSPVLIHSATYDKMCFAVSVLPALYPRCLRARLSSYTLRHTIRCAVQSLSCQHFILDASVLACPHTLCDIR